MPWALINLLFIRSRHTWTNSQKFVKYITYAVWKNCCIFEGNLLLYLYYKQKDKQTVEFTKTYYCYPLHTEFYPTVFSEI
jgi:hypothetical protein